MKKKHERRMQPFSNKWQKLVFNTSGIEPNKQSRKYLQKLWYLGYGHKEASQMIVEFAERAND